ncbi:FUSC family protein [Vibrio crassostreae]|uniref:FUSC family protein n=1 Tax=Vibrio crassostreae TaxID=246167 RepID=UPI001B307635|nr:FUSC family protein [Vibrio crassostreae]
MFNASTKEAIKVALSVVIAICLALWFQWEKPYWAAIAVAVVALNESFAHSIQKGYNRLTGTLLGTGYAFFLIAMFSQDSFLFLTFFALFLAICIFMSSNEKYGYLFSIAFVVCAVISCMGGLDNQNTFHFAVLRLQETVLGIITFSIVFRLVWPVDTEQNFLQRFETSKVTLIDAMKNQETLNLAALESNAINLNKLHQQLNLPLTGSYNLKKNRQHWTLRVDEMAYLQAELLKLESKPDQETIDWSTVLTNLENFDALKPTQSFINESNVIIESKNKAYWRREHRTFTEHLTEDARKVLQGLSMFITSLLVWIYLPVPGGYVFPMIAGVFSAVLPTMPPRIVKDAFFGSLGFGTVVLLQYVFIMPLMSELWQLALFYFINVAVIWKVFSLAHLMIQRVLGINLLVVLTSGALNLTPTYRIETPLLMLVNLFVVLMVAKLFTDIFRIKK